MFICAGRAYNRDICTKRGPIQKIRRDPIQSRTVGRREKKTIQSSAVCGIVKIRQPNGQKFRRPAIFFLPLSVSPSSSSSLCGASHLLLLFRKYSILMTFFFCYMLLFFPEKKRQRKTEIKADDAGIRTHHDNTKTSDSRMMSLLVKQCLFKTITWNAKTVT